MKKVEKQGKAVLKRLKKFLKKNKNLSNISDVKKARVKMELISLKQKIDYLSRLIH